MKKTYYHTQWKRKWGWHNRGCVWDKVATEWAGDAWKKCWTADAVCRLDADSTPETLSSPEALILRDKESNKDDRPLLPRFLLQEILFANSPYEGSFTIGQAFWGIFCADQTGSARDELQTLPILGVARANI